MATEKTDTLEQQFPSLDLAYEIAIASYEAMIKRIDAVDGRIQTLTAFALTACLAIPTLGTTQNLSFNSVWFALAMIGLALATLVSAYARLTGKVRMLNPANLWQDSLHLSPATFKTYAIYYAAEAFKVNNAQLERKWKLSVASMVIFALALGMLVVWVASGKRQS